MDEFLSDFAEDAASFTSDFFFSGSEECGMTIDPNEQATDDLSLSNLEVGKTFSYCVRAVKQGHYMDAPYSNSKERRLLTSSQAACEAHTIPKPFPNNPQTIFLGTVSRYWQTRVALAPRQDPK